ncbi:hypothetical protein Tco_1056962 [Tanacetum coccineum]|uniref:Uncharacterized protein n=1 Tax=Tanacetum coccineum TaxID=301880 RepID=A0ABQ5H5H6_9ASTR
MTHQHAMLKLHEKGIPKKAETAAVLAIREGKIQKDKKEETARGKGFAPQLHESAGGLPKTKLVSHSCSLAGSTSAMKVSNWGGHLHFREVGEQVCNFCKPQGAYLHFSL